MRREHRHVRRKRLPHRRAQSESDLEEERRLLYVGITRAREFLWLTHAAQRFTFGRMEPALPSRFLHEIPPGLLAGGDEDEADGSARNAERSGVVQVVLEDEEGEESAFAVGDLVHHEGYGNGEIVLVMGRGARARVLVRFRSGEREFHLAYGGPQRRQKKHRPSREERPEGRRQALCSAQGVPGGRQGRRAGGRCSRPGLFSALRCGR